LLRQANTLGCKLKLDDVTYYVGHETVIPRHDGKGLPHLVETLFAYLQRNSMHVSDYFPIARGLGGRTGPGDRNLKIRIFHLERAITGTRGIDMLDRLEVGGAIRGIA